MPPGACPPRSARTAAGCARWWPARRSSPTASSTTRIETPALAPANTRDGLLRQWHEERHVGLPGGPIPLRPRSSPRRPRSWRSPGSATPARCSRSTVSACSLDPVWGYRVSPSPVFGPTRLHPAPVPLEDLPPVDAVLISHDHYDHLDLPTVRELLKTQSAPFVVPLGIGEHLRKWGVPGGPHRRAGLERQHHRRRARRSPAPRPGTSPGATSTGTPRCGPRGRSPARRTASSSAATPATRPAFAEIGARLGPFDLTLLPVGAYNDAWHAIHMDPEEAVRAHGDLGGRVLLPIHWATFNLAFHRWAEPVQRVLRRRRPGGRAGRRPPARSADRRAEAAAARPTGGRRSARPRRDAHGDAGVGQRRAGADALPAPGTPAELIARRPLG